MNFLIAPIESLGSRLLTLLTDFGSAWVFLFRVLGKAVLPPYSPGLLMKQLYSIGVQSIAVVALVGGFTGAVLAV